MSYFLLIQIFFCLSIVNYFVKVQHIILAILMSAPLTFFRGPRAPNVIAQRRVSNRTRPNDLVTKRELSTMMANAINLARPVVAPPVPAPRKNPPKPKDSRGSKFVTAVEKGVAEVTRALSREAFVYTAIIVFVVVATDCLNFDSGPFAKYFPATSKNPLVIWMRHHAALVVGLVCFVPMIIDAPAQYQMAVAGLSLIWVLFIPQSEPKQYAAQALLAHLALHTKHTVARIVIVGIALALMFVGFLIAVPADVHTDGSVPSVRPAPPPGDKHPLSLDAFEQRIAEVKLHDALERNREMEELTAKFNEELHRAQKEAQAEATRFQQIKAKPNSDLNDPEFLGTPTYPRGDHRNPLQEHITRARQPVPTTHAHRAHHHAHSSAPAGSEHPAQQPVPIVPPLALQSDQPALTRASCITGHDPTIGGDIACCPKAEYFRWDAAACKTLTSPTGHNFCCAQTHTLV